MPGRKLLYIWFLSLLQPTVAQEVSVRGGFIGDSIKIGQPAGFWMTATYPEQFQVVFPDSNYNFNPFEYVSKSYSPSSKRDDQYFDSVVYHLQSFEIDSVQYLKLPAVLLLNKDSTLIFTPMDSAYLVHLASFVSDTTQLKANTAYWNVGGQLNQPLLWILFISVVMISLIVYLVFGKRIRKYFILKKLRKDYEKFIGRLTTSIREIQDQPEPKIVEAAFNDWKVFLERMEKKPYTKLTTREILNFEETKELKEVLKNIDRCIYGGKTSDGLFREFQSIEDFTQHRYAMVVNEIKNKT